MFLQIHIYKVKYGKALFTHYPDNKPKPPRDAMRVLDCFINPVYSGSESKKHMVSDELKKLLFQVISSWQVLAVTGILIIYIFIVNNVARIYHRRPRKLTLPKRIKPAKPEPSAEADPEAPESDDLDLEEKE